MSYQNVSHCHQIGLFKTALSHTIMLCDMKLWSKSYKPLPVRPHKFRLHGLILSDWSHRKNYPLFWLLWHQYTLGGCVAATHYLLPAAIEANYTVLLQM